METHQQRSLNPPLTGLGPCTCPHTSTGVMTLHEEVQGRSGSNGQPVWGMSPEDDPRVPCPPLGGIFALHAHCALLLDYVPPEEPPSTPLGNALRIK